MNGRTDDKRLKQSMKIILQPMLAEEETYIRTMRTVPSPVPASLGERLQSLLDSHTQKPHPKPYRRVWKRAAIIAAALLMLALAACMAIEPLREKVFGFFVTWYDAYFELRVDSPDTEAVPTAQPLGTFHYIPEGYEIVEDRQIAHKRRVIFRNQAENEIQFDVDSKEIHVNYDVGYTMREDTIHNIPVLILTGEDDVYTCIIWFDESFRYELVGSIPLNELKMIIENLT